MGQPVGAGMADASMPILLLVVLGLLVPASLSLRCPQSVSSFSASVSPGHYYTCTPERVAVLNTCPEGQIYSDKLKECTKNPDEPEIIPHLLTLGRSVRIGSLYDHRTGMFFPESNIWNEDTLRENVHDHDSSPHREVEVQMVQSVIEKQEFMDVNAEIGLSFMDGQVKVTGSAGFMKDKVETNMQVNMVLKYKQDSHFSEIATNTPADYAGPECDNDLYTHFVTRVTYGTNCYFVFKKDTKGGSEQTHVEGELKIVVDAIPNFGIEGEGRVNLTDSETEMLNTTNLRIFGDFSPISNLPSTFLEAVEFYQDTLPILVADRASQTPLEVTLAPFKKNVCQGTNGVLNDIDAAWISEMREMLDDLEQMDMDIGDLIVNGASVAFKPLRENLQFLRAALRKYKLEQQKAMQDILPRIRAGDGAPEEVAALLEAYQDSRFYKRTLGPFIGERRREVNSIRQLMNMYPLESNMELADYERANDVEYIFQRSKVVVVDLNILTPRSLIEDFLHPNSTDSDRHYWFDDNTAMARVGQKVKGLLRFGHSNLDQDDRGYLLKVTGYNESTSFVTTALLNGALVSNQFEFPDEPSMPEISSRTHDQFSFNLAKKPFTTGCRVRINDSEGFEITRDIYFPDQDAATEEEVSITVDKLNAGHVYEAVISYLTDVGESVPSDRLAKFNLPATSAPQGLAISNATTSSLHINWLPPAVTASGVDAPNITYKVSVAGETRCEATSLECLVEDLPDGTEFVITVVPSYDLGWDDVTGALTEGESVSLTTLTSPLPPSFVPEQTVVDLHSAVIAWQPPANLGSPLVRYEVAWNGTRGDRLGERLLLVQGESTEVTDLAMGEASTFRVKMITEKGESAPSEPITLNTPFEQTEMGIFMDEVLDVIDQASENLRNEVRYCAIKADTNVEGIITYDNLFVDVNTVDEIVWMDSATGIFEAQMDGVFRFYIGLEMSWDKDEHHTVTIMVNDEEFAVAIENSGISDTHEEFSSWEGLVQMKAGDAVSVKHHSESSLGLKTVTFCASSENF